MRTFTQKLVLVAGIAGLALAYQNCGSKHAMTPEQLQAMADDAASRTPDAPIGGVNTPPAVLGQPSTKLQLGDMVMRSMSNVTGVPVNNNAVVTEYNLRAAAMSGTLDPQAFTSPLMISVTDLASVYCNTAITTESAQAEAQRRLFTPYNFAAAPNAAQFDALVANLSQKLWGRALTAAEVTIFQQRFTAFNAGFAANTSAANRARYSALFACTAMLSSVDFLTF